MALPEALILANPGYCEQAVCCSPWEKSWQMSY